MKHREEVHTDKDSSQSIYQVPPVSNRGEYETTSTKQAGVAQMFHVKIEEEEEMGTAIVKIEEAEGEEKVEDESGMIIDENVHKFNVKIENEVE